MDVGSIPNFNLWNVSLALPACECLGEAKIPSKIGCTARVWVIIWTQVETIRAIYKNREPALGDFPSYQRKYPMAIGAVRNGMSEDMHAKTLNQIFSKRSQHRKIIPRVCTSYTKSSSSLLVFLRFEMYTTGTHVSWSQFVTLDLACGNPP